MFSRWGKSEVCVRERDRERGGGGEQVPLSLRASCVGAQGVGARGKALNYVCVHTTTVHVKVPCDVSCIS